MAGYDVLEQPIEAKRRTGYLPETPPLYPDMTVSRLPDCSAPASRACRGPSARRGWRRRWSARGSPTWRKRHCGKLSKGYRQRVGLAQALLHNPEVLILDEPTAGLDPKQIIETAQLIKELGGDHTVILSTHILPEVSQTCHRVVIINKGRVVAVDTPDNLTARLRGSESMYLQVDAMGADAGATRWPRCPASRGSRPPTTRRPDQRRSKSTRDSGQRCAAGAGGRRRRPRLGTAGAAADAHEPRRHLPAADDRGHRRSSLRHAAADGGGQ